MASIPTMVPIATAFFTLALASYLEMGQWDVQLSLAMLPFQ
jgi:hypothetical protein